MATAGTESISVGAAGWTSAQAERDYYAAEQARESPGADITMTGFSRATGQYRS